MGGKDKTASRRGRLELTADACLGSLARTLEHSRFLPKRQRAQVNAVLLRMTTALANLSAAGERPRRGGKSTGPASVLNDGEKSYRAIVEHASDGIIICNAKAVILEANAAACAMTGYGARELVGRAITDLLPADEARLKSFRARRVAAGKTLLEECEIRSRNGATLAVEAGVKMLPDGRLLAVLRDVSDRKHAREKMLVYQQRLRLATSRLALAEEGERRRIAKDMHDQVGQELALCRIRLSALADQAGPTPLGDALKEIGAHISSVMAYTRSLTFELASPILYEVGLEAALEELVEGTSGRYGFVCAFENDGRLKSLGADARVILFRAAREVLANAVKHARAKTVKVTASARGSDVVIRVEDDGEGFDVADAEARIQRGGGFGIFSARERLEYIGGGLDIDSHRGRGTRVTIWAPMTTERDA